MAGKRPAFQFYASDWLGSTKHAMMTPAQRGAYIDLLCHQWNDADCTLPDDDKVLAVLSGLNEGWFNGGSTLVRDCFPPAPGKPGRIANPRLVEVRADADEWSRKSREGGIKSGAARRAKSAAAKAYGNSDTPVENEPNANQTRTKREPPLNPPPPPPPPPSSSSSTATSPATPSPPAGKRALVASDNGKASELKDMWNALEGFPECRQVGSARIGFLKARLRESGWWEAVPEALEKMAASNFCRGRTDRGTWVATFDWFLKPDSLNRILEGKYDDAKGAVLSQKNQRNLAALEDFVAEHSNEGEE